MACCMALCCTSGQPVSTPKIEWDHVRWRAIDDPLHMRSPRLQRMALLVRPIMHVIDPDDFWRQMAEHAFGHVRGNAQLGQSAATRAPQIVDNEGPHLIAQQSIEPL